MKRKSLLVALISSVVISLVLVLTLIGYLIYIELKGEEDKRAYYGLLLKANSRIYSKYIEGSKLTAKVEGSGALKGKPIIEGLIKNKGQRDVTDLLIKVKFLDRDGAIIYETPFHPQEPSLGISNLPQISIPYLSISTTKPILKSNGSLPFKKILTNCPREIFMALQDQTAHAEVSAGWPGRLVLEVLAIDFL